VDRFERTTRRTPIVIDNASPASALAPELKRRGKNVVLSTAWDMGKACGLVVARAKAGTVTHGGQDSVTDALAGARKRPIRDAGGWGWDRRDETVNIAPLVAWTLAVFGAVTHRGEPPEAVWPQSHRKGDDATSDQLPLTTPAEVPGVTDDEQQTLNALIWQLERVQERNLLRDSYYDGRRAIAQFGTIIPPSYAKLAVVLGWSGKAVDTLADRCNLDGFVWPDGDLNSLGFREVYDGNYFGTEVASASPNPSCIQCVVSDQHGRRPGLRGSRSGPFTSRTPRTPPAFGMRGPAGCRVCCRSPAATRPAHPDGLALYWMG
jgi:hypothetical protein